MKNEIQLEKMHVAMLSGGKDSLYMFAHIMANIDRYPLDAVIHIKMPFDYPWIDNVMAYVKEKCEILGIKYYEFTPRKTFEEEYNKYCYPSRIARWCNRSFKMDTLRDIDKAFPKNKVIRYVGLCANETSRVKDKDNEIYPLYEMGVFEETIWKWAKNQPLFNDYYKYNRRQGCMYCPMQDMNNSKYNSIYYPDIYNWYMGLAEESEKIISDKKGKPFSVWGSAKYNTPYRRNRIAQMELKEIERW